MPKKIVKMSHEKTQSHLISQQSGCAFHYLESIANFLLLLLCCFHFNSLLHPAHVQLALEWNKKPVFNFNVIKKFLLSLFLALHPPYLRSIAYKQTLKRAAPRGFDNKFRIKTIKLFHFIPLRNVQAREQQREIVKGA
jgi:hypothetical protein